MQRQGDLPPVRHEAWEAGTVRAVNETLSAELQPEVQLLEAVEAPWKEEEGAGGGEGVKIRKVKTAPARLMKKAKECSEEAPGEPPDTAGAKAPEKDGGGMWGGSGSGGEVGVQGRRHLPSTSTP